MNNAPQFKIDRFNLLEQQVRARQQNRLFTFQPYERQAAFLALGAEKRERLLSGGNQTGKSETGAFEMACHLTGLYPKWWVGRRYDRPIHAWAAAETAELARDIAQTKLCGPPGGDETWGTGTIPKALLLGKTAGHGVSDGYDTIRVRHVSGGVSTLGFKAFSQGRARFQGSTLDCIWVDEEPPEDVYSECLARLTGDGCLFITFTPLKGFSNVVSRFLRDDSPEARADRGVIRIGLDHALHFTPEERQRRLLGYPLHERQARAEGAPLLGSGGVWEGVVPADITSSMVLSEVPRHWPMLWAIDLGISHPFAAVLLAWDRDVDRIHIIDCFKMVNGIPVTQAARMKQIAPNVAVAWPHDAGDREKGSGEPMAKLYKAEGLKMLPSHATFSSGGYSTEAGVADMLARMRTDRFKVAGHLVDWWDEFRLYHRRDGLIVKQNDDLMSATRIGVMAIRKAQIPEQMNNGYYRGIRRSGRIPAGRTINPHTGKGTYFYN